MNDDMFVDENENTTYNVNENLNHGGDAENRNPYSEPEQNINNTQGQDNPYENPQQSNPYAGPETPKYGASGKKLGLGFGIASMVLGIISLLCFCSCINIILAILAIIFGIIQIVSYETKGMAVAGIVTATISVILFVTCYALLLSNATFMNMMEEEMGNGFNQREIYEFMQEYTDDVEDML